MLELNMTAMCDVVFQLLIYLILTAHPQDVIAHLDVNRPAPDKQVAADAPPIENLIQIMVFRDGCVLNDRPMTFKGLDSVLTKLAALSKTQTIVIKCALDSQHESLIKVLDMCSKVGLTNISVMSM